MRLEMLTDRRLTELKGWLERHHDVTLLHEAEFKEIVHVFAIVSPPVFGVNTNNNLSSNGWDFDVRFVMMGVEFRVSTEVASFSYSGFLHPILSPLVALRDY